MVIFIIKSKRQEENVNLKEFNYFEYEQIKETNEIQKGTKEKIINNNTSNKGQAHQKYDKTIKLVLNNKEEVAELINRVLKLKNKLKDEDIERYSNSFVNLKYERQEADVVYKKKDQKIFFLIEHQSRVDNTMPLRILDYQKDIIDSALNHRKYLTKGEKIPLIIPIVLYTGSNKWDAKLYLEECQEKLEGVKGVGLGNYFIEDVNTYNKDEVIQNESFLKLVMYIISLKDMNKLDEFIEKMDKNKINKYEYDLILNYIQIINERYSKELGKKLEKNNGGKESMYEIVDSLIADVKKARREGKAEGRAEGRAVGREAERKSVASKLLKKLDKEGKVTLTKEDIENLLLKDSKKIG